MHDDWRSADEVAMAVLAANGGVAKMSMFLEAGLTNRQVGAIHARGVIERPRNAWYAVPGLPWQAMCAIRVGGVLGCTSAAESFGLPTPPWTGRDIHVVVPTNSARRLRRHLPLIDPRAESALETLLRLGMLFRGIDGVLPQFSPDGVRLAGVLDDIEAALDALA